MWSDTIATRGNHQPVWEYLLDVDSDTRAGTTGIYTNPFNEPDHGREQARRRAGVRVLCGPRPGTPNDVRCLPRCSGDNGTTARNTIVFKGNFTVGGDGKTGVFYRDLAPDPIVLEDGD